MSFSDQQACPKHFNIRPIDLHYVFSVFPSQIFKQKPSKSRFYALSRQAILHAANDLPMPIHPSPRILEVFLPKWRAEGSGNSPSKQGPKTSYFKQINLLETNSNSTCQVAPSPKRKVFFCLPTIQPWQV